MRHLFFLVSAAMLLGGCSENQPYASQEEIATVSYRDPETPHLTLITMVNNRSGAGAHSALLINASERVIFDPAGSFYLDLVPERNDVLFGISPKIEQAYKSAHARSTFHVKTQKIEVTPEQAQAAYELALRYGPVPQSFCANATSTVLSQVPGFQSIRTTLYPNKLADQFEQIAGVQTDRYYEEDSPDLQKALAEGNALALAEQKQ